MDRWWSYFFLVGFISNGWFVFGPFFIFFDWLLIASRGRVSIGVLRWVAFDPKGVNPNGHKDSGGQNPKQETDPTR